MCHTLLGNCFFCDSSHKIIQIFSYNNIFTLISFTCYFTICKHGSGCGKSLTYINYMFAVRLYTQHVNPAVFGYILRKHF